MNDFFRQLQWLLVSRFGTSYGSEKNVHRRKAGPGRMPQSRTGHNPAGTKVLRKFAESRAD